MRLCDRDIEAWLDEGRLSINPRPPVERINGATVDVRLGNKFRTFRGHTAAFIAHHAVKRGAHFIFGTAQIDKR
ncbi:hypothetical protein ACUN9W_15720, partial [Escherichia coli]